MMLSVLKLVKIFNIITPNLRSLTLRLNIDGLRLTNSTKSCLWPILALTKEIPEIEVVMIGVYHGLTKPNSINDYLKEFIADFKTIIKDGFVFEGKVLQINLLDAFVCDAHTRSFLKCIKGHVGCYSCERYMLKRKHHQSRIIFNETEAR